MSLKSQLKHVDSVSLVMMCTCEIAHLIQENKENGASSFVKAWNTSHLDPLHGKWKGLINEFVVKTLIFMSLTLNFKH